MDMPTQTQTNPATPNFRRHPAMDAAKQFDDKVAAMRGNQSTASGSAPFQTQPTLPAQPEQATLTPVMTMTPPPGYEDALKDLATPPVQQPQPPQQAPTTSAADDELAKYREQNASLLKDMETLRQQLAESHKQQEELRRLKEEQELDKLLSGASGEFSSIDKDDAKRLLTPLINTMRDQTKQSNERSEARVQELEKKLQARLDDMDKREEWARVNDTRNRILQAVPDLEELRKTDAYQRVMLSPVGGNSALRVGQLVAAEYQNGRTDYIISVLNQIRQEAKPDLDRIASVSPTTTGTTPAGGASQNGKLTIEQIAEYKNMVQTGKLSRQAFREIMNKDRGVAS